jgi:hypothetical protein
VHGVPDIGGCDGQPGPELPVSADASPTAPLLLPLELDPPLLAPELEPPELEPPELPPLLEPPLELLASAPESDAFDPPLDDPHATTNAASTANDGFLMMSSSGSWGLGEARGVVRPQCRAGARLGHSFASPLAKIDAT